MAKVLAVMKNLSIERCAVVLLVCSVFPKYCLAFEPFALQPGTRAAAMAGIFSPQADDSSAIWYNPGGLKRQGAISTDASIDIAQYTTRKTDPDSGVVNSQYGETNAGIRFAGIYTDHIPWLSESKDPIGTGFGFFTLYNLQINVDAPQSPIDQTPFGLVETTYRQGSWLLGAALGKKFSLGGTVDMVWSSVSCLQFDPCVENDPVGFGGSLGAMLDLIQGEHFNMKLGVTWRSKAEVKYSSTPTSGIGTVLESYLPARPETRNLGLNIQLPASWAFININTLVEQVLWSKAAASNQSLPDYINWGVSSEFLIAHSAESSWSIRTGYRNSNSNDEQLMPNASILAVGAGFIFLSHHAIDLAFESRNIDASGETSANSVSVSYSLQY